MPGGMISGEVVGVEAADPEARSMGFRRGLAGGPVNISSDEGEERKSPNP